MLKSVLAAVIITACAGSVSAQTTDGAAVLKEIAGKMAATECAKGSVNFEVMLPSAPDPVVYTIAIESRKVPADTITGCDYLVDWTLHKQDGGASTGFAAYFDGNHFRYRDIKLQEYHVSDDPVPFLGEKGVALSAQFASLVPQIMARQIAKMASDTTYVYKVTKNAERITVRGVERIHGYDAMEYEYVFDAKTGLPVSIDQLYNPASITEQTNAGHFTWVVSNDCTALTEESLTARYPEVFEKYRVSNFKVHSLLGAAMPAFSARATDGSRYVHDRNTGFAQRTVIAVLDPAVASAEQTVRDLRLAADSSPVPFSIIFAVADNDADKVRTLTGTLRDGETALSSARSLVRDCGISVFPTLLFCNTKGIVKEIQLGTNNNLPDIVIQKTTICD